jgi:hypothetical protein
MQKDEFTNIVKNSEIIVTQPIHDNYKNVDYLSTNYIINNANKNAKIIIFDNCYFNFYYFDLTYSYFNNKLLQTPIDYHYNKMMECYKENYSENYYIENYVNNENLKNSDELEIIAENGLIELKNRYDYSKTQYNFENVHIISVYEFIKNNYKDKLLFYSMNHPTKYVLEYVCEEIIKELNFPNTIDYSIDTFNGIKCILYKCIQKAVNFNINDYSPLTQNATCSEEITKLYYNNYKIIGYS